MIISNENFSDMTEIPAADEYRDCNFSHSEPLWVDDVPMGHPLTNHAVFTDCNMRNVEAVNADRERSSGCIAPIMTNEVFYRHYNVNTGEYSPVGA